MPACDEYRGEITDPNIDQEQIWSCFNVLFSSQSRNTTSYKFGLIRALLENLYNVDSKLGLCFDSIFWSFACLYWNLVIQQGLRQMGGEKRAAIESVLEDFRATHGIPREIGFYSISPDLQLRIVAEVKKQVKRYVFGAVWGDTKGTFYEFDVEKEYLRINPPVYHLMQKYQEVLYRLNSYEFAKYLQKVNPPDTHGDLIQKVENITRRSSLVEYRSMLEFNSARQCFYCGAELSGGRTTTEVDHFIPWSFVHNDNLWNFVLACRTCNNSKRDHLAAPMFLEHLVVRNESLRRISQSPVIVEMTNYSDAKLIDLYQYAQNNGYSADWSPHRRLA